MHSITHAVAGERIEYGWFVTIDDGIARHDPDGTGKGGIAKRPPEAMTRTAYEPGETVIILTSGGALGQFGRDLRWAEVRHGRLLTADHDSLS